MKTHPHHAPTAPLTTLLIWITALLVVAPPARGDEEHPWELTYYPSFHKIRIEFPSVETRPRDPVPVRVTDDADETIVEGEVSLDPHGVALLEVGDVPDGKYTVHVTPPGSDRPQTEYFQRKHFVWENNQLGITTEVYPPFLPIGVDGDEVEVVMRRYRQSGLGLWSSVKATGNDPEAEYEELLAGPVRLIANGDETLEGEGRFTETAGHRVVYEGRAKHPAVEVSTRSVTEYDGCMRVEMTLSPPETPGTTLESLRLEIPLRDEQASLFHALKCNIRTNPAGRTPQGSREIWNSAMLADKKWHGNFKRYLWLGGEERGLTWFADNERGWVMDWDNQPPCQTLHRDNGVVTLRIHLVQRPIALEEPRTIVFGLMASPAKPMPEDWRAIGRSDHHGIDFTMGWVFGLPSFYASRYPLNKDAASGFRVGNAALRVFQITP